MGSWSRLHSTPDLVETGHHRDARRPSRVRRTRLVSAVAIAPALILALVFIAYPVFQTARLAFSEWDGLGEPTYVGLVNFQRLLIDATFQAAVRNTLYFAVVVTSLTMILGTAFAIAIDRRVRLWRVYLFFYFLPVVMPLTAIALIWVNALDPNYGSVDRLIALVDARWRQAFLSDSSLAMTSICLVAIWASTGFAMVLMLGGVRRIPREVQEAATLDGVDAWTRATRITVPLSKDVLATVALLQLIWSFKVFDIVQAMTRGGPGDSTQVLGTLIYKDAFLLHEFGYASAIAIVTSVIIGVISGAYLLVFRPGRVQRHG